MDSGLSTEMVTATRETENNFSAANKDQKFADFPIAQSGNVTIIPNVQRSGRENLMTSEMMSENFDTGVRDDAGLQGVTEQLETQSFSYHNGGSIRDDLLYVTAVNYSGHGTYSRDFTEVTSLSWSRKHHHHHHHHQIAHQLSMAVSTSFLHRGSILTKTIS